MPRINKKCLISFLVQALRNLWGVFYVASQLKIRGHQVKYYCTFWQVFRPSLIPKSVQFARRTNKLRWVGAFCARCSAAPKLFYRKPCLSLFELQQRIQLNDSRKSFVSVKNARQKPRKKGSEQSSQLSLNVCEINHPILDILSQLCYNVGVKCRRA